MTKDQIIELLRTDKRAVVRALLVLTSRQTEDEQRTENTRYLNGRGFRPCHARMGTTMAKFFQKNGYLSDKQIEYWRRPMKGGKMRIEIYAGQLLEAVEEKEKERQTKFGGFKTELEHLEYELGMVMDSDDPALIDPLVQKIAKLKAKKV